MDSGSSSACRTCESKDFATENGETVCTNCGDVQDDMVNDGQLCMLPDSEAILDNLRNKNFESNERLGTRIRNETNSGEERSQIYRGKILDDMHKIVKQFVKHPRAVDETMNLIESVLKAHRGRLFSAKKLGLAGACVYFLSAKHQLGISLTDICKATGIKLRTISVCLKQVRELCPDFEYERPNLKDMVKKFVDELSTKHFDPLSLETTENQPRGLGARQKPIPLIDSKDKLVLENRVMMLIDLYEAMNPYNRPSPQRLIKTALYHAWRSLDTFKILAINLSSGLQDSPKSSEAKLNDNPDSEELSIEQTMIRVKHSISFERFCQLSNLKYCSRMHKMVSKLQTSLLLLGKYLGDVNKMNLPWYLKDIIENSAHLIEEHKRSDV